MKVLVFGSLNIDYVYRVKHFVRPGETLSSVERNVFCGGKGLNQSIALARSGVETYHAGAVGTDDSHILIEKLKESGVHTELIRRKSGPSGHAVIQTTPEGENCIILYGGANRMLTEEDVDFVLSHFSDEDILVLQNEINQMGAIMERARAMGMRIVLNPSPADEGIFKLPLSYVDYLILNEVEGAALCNGSLKDRDGLLGELMGRFPHTHIVLTLGKEGSAYGYGDKVCCQPVYPVETVDTTAAGDTFAGFFIGSIVGGESVEAALKTASMAAAIAVSRDGASSSIPSFGEVEEYKSRWI